MLLGLTYQLIRFIADLVLVRSCSYTQLRAEVLALRHQLRVLERKVDKPAWQPGDRILLSALSRLLPRSGLPSLQPRPETLLLCGQETLVPVTRRLGRILGSVHPGDLAARFGPPPAGSPRAGRSASAGPPYGVKKTMVGHAVNFATSAVDHAASANTKMRVVGISGARGCAVKKLPTPNSG